MFSGIRGRLLLSYILLLVVTLAVIAVTLILFLSTRPAVSQEAVQRELLNTVVDAVRGQRPGQRLRGETPIVEQILREAERDNVRYLFMDTQQLAVVFDSAEIIPRGGSIPTIREEQPLRPRPDEIPIVDIRAATGIFEDGGNYWVFVRVEMPPRLMSQVGYPEANAFMVAQLQPTTSLIVAIREFGANLGVPLLQAAVAGVTVALFLAIVISRTIARPLQRMSEAAGAVAEGDYSQRVPEQGPREVQDVAHAFNRMSEQVELNNQAQRDLLANVSHDLKTPLTSIQGYSQAIMDGTAPDSSKAAQVIYDEAGRLTRLVSMLTELARLKAGRLTMRQDDLNVSAMVEAMAQNIDVVAQKKNITLHTNIQPTPIIKGDGDRLAQVINNLLSNAVKYTPKGGQVLAAVQQNGSGIQVVVRDTGVGIPPEDISRVFERFYQVDKSRGPQRGHGLGLAITHEIVVAHGGKITVESDGAGKGSTFTVWLPTAA